MVTLMTTTLVTVGTFSGFCLAANSGEKVGQKMITGVPENSNNSENKKMITGVPENSNNSENKKIVNAKPSNEKIDEEQLKKELPKIIEEIKKFEESESKSNGSGSSNGDKCIIVNDEQIKKEIAKSREIK